MFVQQKFLADNFMHKNRNLLDYVHKKRNYLSLIRFQSVGKVDL